MTAAEQIRAALHKANAGLALAALDALEAEHADRVWLTRDEAKALRRYLGRGRFVALLDERIGDK